MELRRSAFFPGRSGEENFTSSISAPMMAVAQTEIPTCDSFFSTESNSEIYSVSSISTSQTSPKVCQTQTTLNAVIPRSIEKTSSELTSLPTSEQLYTQTAQSCIPREDRNPKLELQYDSFVWQCLKKQDEQLIGLKEQMTHLLEQKTNFRCPDPTTAIVPTNDSATIMASDTKSGALVGSSEISQLLSSMNFQQEQILRLQEEMLKLQDRNHTLQMEKQKLLEKNHELTYQLLLKSERQPLAIADRLLHPEFLDPVPSLETGSEEVPLQKISKPLCNGDLQTPKTGNGKISSKKHNCSVSNNDHHKETTSKKGSRNKTNSSTNGNLKIRDDQEIEKTSTSTMTSLIYDGNDKVVYQKLTTVTTDLKKQRSELLAECSVSKDAVITPVNRSTPKDVTSSSRRKAGKCRKCGKCSPHDGSGKKKGIRNGSLDAIENGCEKRLEESPRCGSETIREVPEIVRNKNEIHNTKRIISPRYENILKNVNELSLNNEDEQVSRVEPILKPISKDWKRNSPYTAVDSTPMSQKSENRRFSDRSRTSTASNSSTESIDDSRDYCRPEASYRERTQDKTAGSTTISIYGLSSPNLSKDTREYLDNFGLVRNRKGDNSKSYRSRTTLAKRYLR